MNIGTEIGQLIRAERKKQALTLEMLAGKINKSISTLGKYEKGEITIDIATLYDIADALQINIEHLLIPQQHSVNISNPKIPTFFAGLSQFYGYIYDGRVNAIIRCVFDIIEQLQPNKFKLIMYMNFKSFDHYQAAENIYDGDIEHFDALTHIALTNRHMPMEKASAQVLASQLEADTKLGLFNGFSTRPMMPIATKILLARKRLDENEELIEQLKISKEDIKLYRLYNMLIAI